MNQLSGAPILVLATLVMVSLVFIPQRHKHLRLGAVLGWAVVWVDNQISGHWSDWLGTAVVVTCLGLLVSAYRLERGADDRH